MTSNIQLTFTPSPQEQNYYDLLFAEADRKKCGSLSGGDAVSFLSRSKLPVALLKNIWLMADNPRTNSLDKRKFYNAVRLIQLYQNGQKAQGPSLAPGDSSIPLKPVFFEGFAAPPPPPAPAPAPAPTHEVPVQAPNEPSNTNTSNQVGEPPLSTTTALAPTQDAYSMSPQDQARYDALFPTYEVKGDGFVYGAEAVALFSRSGLSTTQLRDIWNLSDDPVDNRLDKIEFAIAMHLIVCVSRKNLSLPTSLPASLALVKGPKSNVESTPTTNGVSSLSYQEPQRPQQQISAPSMNTAPQPQPQPSTTFQPSAYQQTLPPSQPTQQSTLTPQPTQQPIMTPHQQQPILTPQPTAQPIFTSQPTAQPILTPQPPPQPMISSQMPPMSSYQPSFQHMAPPPSQFTDSFTPTSPNPSIDTATKSHYSQVGKPPLGPNVTSRMAISDAFSGLGTEPPEAQQNNFNTMPTLNNTSKLDSHDNLSTISNPSIASTVDHSHQYAQKENKLANMPNATQPTSQNDASELGSLQKVLQQLRAENISLKAQLGTYSHDEIEVKKEISRTVAEIDTLSKELMSLRAQVAQASVSLVEATSELKVQMEKKAVLQEAIAQELSTLKALQDSNVLMQEVNQMQIQVSHKNDQAYKNYEVDFFGFDSPMPNVPPPLPPGNPPNIPPPPAPEFNQQLISPPSTFPPTEPDPNTLVPVPISEPTPAVNDKPDPDPAKLEELEALKKSALEARESAESAKSEYAQVKIRSEQLKREAEKAADEYAALQADGKKSLFSKKKHKAEIEKAHKKSDELSKKSLEAKKHVEAAMNNLTEYQKKAEALMAEYEAKEIEMAKAESFKNNNANHEMNQGITPATPVVNDNPFQ